MPDEPEELARHYAQRIINPFSSRYSRIILRSKIEGSKTKRRRFGRFVGLENDDGLVLFGPVHKHELGELASELLRRRAWEPKERFQKEIGVSGPPQGTGTGHANSLDTISVWIAILGFSQLQEQSNGEARLRNIRWLL